MKIMKCYLLSKPNVHQVILTDGETGTEQTAATMNYIPATDTYIVVPDTGKNLKNMSATNVLQKIIKDLVVADPEKWKDASSTVAKEKTRESLAIFPSWNYRAINIEFEDDEAPEWV